MARNATTFGAERKPAGRPKGIPNKSTILIKQAILRAFEKVGGEDYLVRVAEEDPKTFCALLGRVLPLEVTGGDGGPLRLVVMTGVPQADPPPVQP